MPKLKGTEGLRSYRNILSHIELEHMFANYLLGVATHFTFLLTFCISLEPSTRSMRCRHMLPSYWTNVKIPAPREFIEVWCQEQRVFKCDFVCPTSQIGTCFMFTVFVCFFFLWVFNSNPNSSRICIANNVC